VTPEYLGHFLRTRLAVSLGAVYRLQPILRSEKREQVIGKGLVNPDRRYVYYPKEIGLPTNIEIYEQDYRKLELLAPFVVGFKGPESVLSVDYLHRKNTSFGLPIWIF
jgi:hypothetical protein